MNRKLASASIDMSGTSHFVRVSPAGPFLKPDTATSEGIHYCFADKRATGTFACLRSLVGGPCVTRHHHALRALLRCDFAVRSESIGCSAHSLPTPSSRGPFHVGSQSYTLRVHPTLTGSATRREKGPTPKAWEVSARAAIRLRSRREIGYLPVRTVFYTAVPEDRRFIKASWGARGQLGGGTSIANPPTCLWKQLNEIPLNLENYS